MANIVGFGVDGLISAETGGLNGSSGGDDLVSSDCGATVEFDGGGFIPACMDLLDTAFHFADTAEAAVLILKKFHDHAHAVEWSGEAFEKEGAKHDGELAIIHIMLLRAAIIHDGAENHVLQQWVGYVTLHGFTSGGGHRAEIKGVEGADFFGKGEETVDLLGEGAGDFGLEKSEFIVESELAVGEVNA